MSKTGERRGADKWKFQTANSWPENLLHWRVFMPYPTLCCDGLCTSETGGFPLGDFLIEKKETDLEIIVGSHSSSPCYLSPTSSWESATQFLGTTGNKSTDHLKWSTKIARIWHSSCERVPFFKANITKKFYLFFGASLVSHSLSGIYLARLRFPFCNRPHVGWVIALVKCSFIILVLLFMHQNGKMRRNQAAEKFFQERRGFPPVLPSARGPLPPSCRFTMFPCSLFSYTIPYLNWLSCREQLNLAFIIERELTLQGNYQHFP